MTIDIIITFMIENVRLIRSKRKTICIQVNSDLSVTVRAPKWVSKYEIQRFVLEKEGWINHQVEKIKLRNANKRPALTDKEINELADKAMVYIPERVKYYAPLVGVDYGRITIRNQKTRWGSCSSKGNLNFNCMLMLTPPEVIDYVVVHELCHRKEMNHSKAFWDEVERILPDYKEAKKWIRNHEI